MRPPSSDRLACLNGQPLPHGPRALERLRSGASRRRPSTHGGPECPGGDQTVAVSGLGGLGGGAARASSPEGPGRPAGTQPFRRDPANAWPVYRHRRTPPDPPASPSLTLRCHLQKGSPTKPLNDRARRRGLEGRVRPDGLTPPGPVRGTRAASRLASWRLRWESRPQPSCHALPPLKGLASHPPMAN